MRIYTIVINYTKDYLITKLSLNKLVNRKIVQFFVIKFEVILFIILNFQWTKFLGLNSIGSTYNTQLSDSDQIGRFSLSPTLLQIHTLNLRIK